MVLDILGNTKHQVYILGGILDILIQFVVVEGPCHKIVLTTGVNMNKIFLTSVRKIGWMSEFEFNAVQINIHTPIFKRIVYGSLTSSSYL